MKSRLLLSAILLYGGCVFCQNNVFNNLNWITSVNYFDGSKILYNYDKLGNRISYQIIPENNCTYTVDNTNDDGLGSLRKAIECASPDDTIHFASSLTNKFINLTSS